jgi:transglutaminase-like putative cysteine protease
MELRVRPRNTDRQTVWQHRTELDPPAPLELFMDYFGNWVEFACIPFRHEGLTVLACSEVETRAADPVLQKLELTVCEVRALYPKRREVYDFIFPSRRTPLLPEVRELARELFPDNALFPEAILDLGRFVHQNFRYEPGATDVSTPLEEVLCRRKGVCQDFTHLCLAVARAAGLAARYASGYIEPVAPGDSGPAPATAAVASHAWLQIYSPGGDWIGLDPTNNSLEGESHVLIGVGRDYSDVAPLRGVFKGPRDQFLSVHVTVERVWD